MQDDCRPGLPTQLSCSELSQVAISPLVEAHGAAGRFAWEEFFLGRIRNGHTRRAYQQAVSAFLTWCDRQRVELQGITPGMVGQYFDQHTGSPPTKKLHMSAIRGLFDVLVQRHVLILNPALSVRTERYSVTEGRTPEITIEQVRQLRDSIRLDSVVDHRDLAIINMLTFTAARVGAIAKLRIRDLRDDGRHMSVRFREKGGKQRLIPVRISLQDELEEYLRQSRMSDETDKDLPLFRTAGGRSAQLSNRPMSGVDILRMIRRRLKQAGLPTVISCHSFRACAATDLLLQSVPLEDVQYLLGHSDSRVTRLYDRRKRQVTRNIVERISA